MTAETTKPTPLVAIRQDDAAMLLTIADLYAPRAIPGGAAIAIDVAQVIARVREAVKRGEDKAATIREQAKRYLVAVYGPEWLYRAPESFEGGHRWIWAVANDQAAMAEAAMAGVEQVCAERRAGSAP